MQAVIAPRELHEITQGVIQQLMNSLGLNSPTFPPPPTKDHQNPMNGFELAANASAVFADAHPLNRVQRQQHRDLPVDGQFLIRIL